MTRERRSSKQTLAVLEVLLQDRRNWRHGYDLSAQTQLQSGTLYPLLMRLSDRGFVESRWEPSEFPGKPPRRLHRLTAAGVAYAKEQLAAATPTSLRPRMQPKAG